MAVGSADFHRVYILILSKNLTESKADKEGDDVADDDSGAYGR